MNKRKSHNFEKKLKGGPFGYFQHPFCRKTPEKMKAELLRNFFCLEEVALCRNNENNIEKFYRFFFEILLKSAVNRSSAEKCKRRDPLGFFERPFCCKLSKKIKGGPFGDIEKFAKKSHKAEITCTKKCLEEVMRYAIEPTSHYADKREYFEAVSISVETSAFEGTLFNQSYTQRRLLAQRLSVY